MARNQHTFAKRQREMAKKRKAQEKRLKRQKTPHQGEVGPSWADPTQPDGGTSSG